MYKGQSIKHKVTKEELFIASDVREYCVQENIWAIRG
jgi:hypothetical protein